MLVSHKELNMDECKSDAQEVFKLDLWSVCMFFFIPSLWTVNEFLFMSLEIEIEVGLK